MRLWVAAGMLALALTGAAHAQNLSLSAPDWATRLVAADLLPTTGGRAALAADGIDLAVRVTIAPRQGGVARVVRYEAGRGGDRLFLRRFTGHPTTGWWLYGPDTPEVSAAPTALRTEIARLARAALSAEAGVEEACPSGERIFVEIYSGGRSASAARSCVGGDAVGALARRLSDAAGSRTEEELFAAAREELLAADRAFNASAQRDGIAAAFRTFAAQDAVIFPGGTPPRVGPDAIAQVYAALPAGTRLAWAPEDARVSARGDMGWTWGRATMTDAQGRRTPLQYVTIWTRDYEGNWRFAADLGVEGER